MNVLDIYLHSNYQSSNSRNEQVKIINTIITTTITTTSTHSILWCTYPIDQLPTDEAMFLMFLNRYHCLFLLLKYCHP